ncbi:MAG: hypothetical protein EBT83_13505, partial [Betaproteobacteria bacterium]|nr:hypothetical protein [Betaproteobacteria bacterium]
PHRAPEKIAPQILLFDDETRAQLKCHEVRRRNADTRETSKPSTVESSTDVATQPYQYMAGPSSRRGGAKPGSMRSVPG